MSKQQPRIKSLIELAAYAPIYRPTPESTTPMPTQEGDSFEPSPNVGWLYYKDYFRDLDLSKEPDVKANGKKLKPKNEALVEQSLPPSGLIPESVHQFELVTTYPGLLSGIGMKHETKQAEGELKLGFAFDHTTGLPYIAGSGIKGKLRAFFPNLLRQNAAKQRVPELKDYLEHRANQLEVYISDVLEKQFLEMNQHHTFTAADIALLERNIFDGIDETGKQINLYRRDIFYDAVAVESENDHKQFLFTDSITPHPHPLKDPTPLQFLKVGPNVKFRVSFRLGPLKMNGVDFSAASKEKLFKYLLLQHGAGAKTRVGYGQFTE